VINFVKYSIKEQIDKLQKILKVDFKIYDSGVDLANYFCSNDGK
jgi:hypothetical protein